MPSTVKMTEYSHGAGCGCKISPATLDIILKSQLPTFTDQNLLVGNDSKDDAAVYDIGSGYGVISTTDFFMPIVDDAFSFGRIAATNAISDIYAMGGKPVMAIAILGWPLDKLPAEVGQQVMDGGRQACADAGISLAGGHSIDSPEPIFGLAVTGMVDLSKLKRNDTAQAGDRLYLTKPLGVGILSTAQKQKKIRAEHADLAQDSMCVLNDVGMTLAMIDGVNAMTDVTGFGLAGHLKELCQGSDLRAEVNFNTLPLLPRVLDYLSMGCSPGGAQRNFDSYGSALNGLKPYQQAIVCDPQTSGGLLIAVNQQDELAVQETLKQANLALECIGQLYPQDKDEALISVLEA